MSRAPSFAGVILAAGESSRMGQDKALLPWPPRAPGSLAKDTFLSAAIRSLALSTDFIGVVAGKNQKAIEAVAYSNGASIITNPDPSRGQFSSLQVGLHEVLNHGRDAALITLVDRPPAQAATVKTLRATFEAAPQNVWAVVPEFSGKRGHPFVVGRELIEVFLQAPATASARDLLRLHQERIQYVSVNDPCISMNINTPEDYAGLAAQM